MDNAPIARFYNSVFLDEYDGDLEELLDNLMNILIYDIQFKTTMNMTNKIKEVISDVRLVKIVDFEYTIEDNPEYYSIDYNIEKRKKKTSLENLNKYHNRWNILVIYEKTEYGLKAKTVGFSRKGVPEIFDITGTINIYKPIDKVCLMIYKIAKPKRYENRTVTVENYRDMIYDITNKDFNCKTQITNTIKGHFPVNNNTFYFENHKIDLKNKNISFIARRKTTYDSINFALVFRMAGKRIYLLAYTDYNEFYERTVPPQGQVIMTIQKA